MILAEPSWVAGGHGTTAAHHCGQLMVSSELCEQKPDDESWAEVMVGPSGNGMISPSPGSRTQHSAQQSAARPGSTTNTTILALSLLLWDTALTATCLEPAAAVQCRLHDYYIIMIQDCIRCLWFVSFSCSIAVSRYYQSESFINIVFVYGWIHWQCD